MTSEPLALFFRDLTSMDMEQRNSWLYGKFHQSTESKINYMDQYKEFCRLRDSRKPGAEVPEYTEAEAFAMVAIQAAAGELAFLAKRHEQVMDNAILFANELSDFNAPSWDGRIAFSKFAAALTSLKEEQQLVALLTLANYNLADAAESVDTPEFQKLLTWFRAACVDPYSGIETRAMEPTREAIVTHLTTWGAQQHEAGRLQGWQQREEIQREIGRLRTTDRAFEASTAAGSTQ